MIGKVAVLGLIAAIAVVVVNSQGDHWRPRPDDRCPGGVSQPPHLLPDPSDCTRFFVCVNFDAHPVSCPEGQHFSVELNRCDWPEVANCNNHPSECPAADTLPPTFFPSDSDCTKYYICSGGVAHERTCPPGQHWDHVRNDRCEWPDRANCNLGGGGGGGGNRTSEEV